MRVGSLFSGAGGLDRAVEEVFGATVAWQCEVDAAASKVLAHRFPGVPNYGDITTIGNWQWQMSQEANPIDIICGGFPCQDVSAAGRRAGIRDGTRSGLWAYFADAIAALRPKYVVIENVKGLLNAAAHRNLEPDEPDMGDGPVGPVLRAAGAVLGDLADLRYDAQWVTVAASEVGAPHQRERVFILATNTEIDRRDERRPEPARQFGRSDAAFSGPTNVGLLPTPTVQDGANCAGPSQFERNSLPLNVVATLLPTPSASDGIGGGPNDPVSRVENGHQVQLIDLGMRADIWGRYSSAMRRWEGVTRSAPSPVEPSPRGKFGARLNPAFSEWMMGWPEGWVTDVPGISRNDKLRIIGNGVVPQQATAALRWLLEVAA